MPEARPPESDATIWKWLGIDGNPQTMSMQVTQQQKLLSQHSDVVISGLSCLGREARALSDLTNSHSAVISTVEVMARDTGKLVDGAVPANHASASSGRCGQ